MSVNLTKNQDDITRAWRQVVDSKDAQEWALFGYEGNTNNIRLMSTGSKGLNELVQEFNCSLIQYAFCRIIEKELNINKLVLINWQGESSPLSRKGLCASHVGDVVSYFKGCTQTITIRNDDEATYEYLMDQISKTSSQSRISMPRQTSNSNNEASSTIGSSYNKTDISSEISVDRKSFWQRQEEEEKERLTEERKRAAEKQAQFERERKLREESEAKKLAETIRERDRIIEATRQAERRETSGSQPSSILALNTDDNDDDRVGRRSELIRLERNQETQSLIGKGLIKNKRAIFEQASQQQQNPQPAGTNTARRTSRAMIAQRLNSFKSLDSNSSSSVDKLTNGFVTQVNIDDNQNSNQQPMIVKKEIETVKVTIPDDQEQGHISIDTSANSSIQEPKNDSAISDMTKETPSPIKNKDSISNVDPVELNGNSSNVISKSPKQEPKVEADGVVLNGKYGIKAKALYDYQAADNTEISFDPDDIIGFIEKVDSGWWHGSVVTGHYKGQCGLFPANYVEEL